LTGEAEGAGAVFQREGRKQSAAVPCWFSMAVGERAVVSIRQLSALAKLLGTSGLSVDSFAQNALKKHHP